MKVMLGSIGETERFARKIASFLRGGEVIELIGDVGSGKTTFTKGLAKGLGISEDVSSPSFTISRVYEVNTGIGLHHYDFYRLNDPGIMSYDIAESTADRNVVTVVEWAETVKNILPADRYRLYFSYTETESARHLVCEGFNNEMEGACAAWAKN